MRKRIFAIVLAVVSLMAMTVTCFASEPAKVVSAEDFQSVLDALSSQISISTVVGIIVAVIGAGIGFVFLWWGVRKVFGAVMKAFKGKGLSV